MDLLEKKLAKFGTKLELKRMKKLINALNNPQEKMKVIIIGGTNGKGSVVSYISSILKEAGYKTGSYYSPHVENYNERIRINGRMITEKKFKKYEKEILGFYKKGYKMTLFEAVTAIAYKYFSDEDCDFAVMEVGMGGRFDAVNIAEEAVGVITNIGLEHSKHLGDTVEKIAREKAGIIKKGLCVTGAEGEALYAIKDESRKRGFRMKVKGEDFFPELTDANHNLTEFNYLGVNYYRDLKTGMLGRNQVDNASIAIAVCEELGVEEKAIRKGLKNAKNKGRMEVIERKPLVLVDAAHNVEGIKSLIGNLDLFDYDRIIAVFGVMKDKNWKEMLRIFAPHCDLLIATKPKGERSEDPKKIAKTASVYTEAISLSDSKKAFQRARKKAKKKDMIIICGSIYLLGEFFKHKR